MHSSIIVYSPFFSCLIPFNPEPHNRREVTSLGLELNRAVDPTMARKRLLQAISDAFNLELLAAPAHLTTNTAASINSKGGEDDESFLWGDALVDDGALSDEEWLAKHQRPL